METLEIMSELTLIKNGECQKKREAAGTKKYTVFLGGTATVCGYYTVDAHNEEEARELAIKQKSMIDWEIDFGTSVDDVEVFDVEENKE